MLIIDRWMENCTWVGPKEYRRQYIDKQDICTRIPRVHTFVLPKIHGFYVLALFLLCCQKPRVKTLHSAVIIMSFRKLMPPFTPSDTVIQGTKCNLIAL